MDTWKAFEQNEVTHSGAHYLMAIHDLIEQRGYARVSDVARALEITRGSASLALKALRERGFVDQDENRFLLLSEDGERIAHDVRSRHAVLEAFFREVLHVEADQAQIDACKIEHLISTESGERLLALLQHLLRADTETRSILRQFWADEEMCSDQSRCPVCDDTCLARGWMAPEQIQRSE